MNVLAGGNIKIIICWHGFSIFILALVWHYWCSVKSVIYMESCTPCNELACPWKNGASNQTWTIAGYDGRHWPELGGMQCASKRFRLLMIYHNCWNNGSCFNSHLTNLWQLYCQRIFHIYPCSGFCSTDVVQNLWCMGNCCRWQCVCCAAVRIWHPSWDWTKSDLPPSIWLELVGCCALPEQHAMNVFTIIVVTAPASVLTQKLSRCKKFEKKYFVGFLHYGWLL